MSGWLMPLAESGADGGHPFGLRCAAW